MRVARYTEGQHLCQTVICGSRRTVPVIGRKRQILLKIIELSVAHMLLGMGSHFEIWDAAKLAENEQAAVDGPLPDVLSNFSF